jgi:cobalt-zinc-cadmium efflux system membrane fusion protein
MYRNMILSCITIFSVILLTGCGGLKDTAEKNRDEHKGVAHLDHAGESKEEHDAHEGEAHGAHEGEAHGAHEGEAHDAHEGEAHDAHEGEAHDAHEGEAADAHEGEAADAHEGEAADAHEGEVADAHEGEITITPEAMAMAEITSAKAKVGRIDVSLDLSGDVGFNEDRLVHITPRFSGVAKEARFRVGEFVNAGDIVAIIESNESMTQYSLKAPISGRIIEKHVSAGEHVSVEESIYMLADLSSVWVNLAVYPKDASKIKPGLKVLISAVGTENVADGVIQYVTPVVDIQTRRIIARVVLPNKNGIWRPGTFVKAHVVVGKGDEGVVVEKSAVQILNDKNVVFVQHEPGSFKPVEVTVGESDSRLIRITGGLNTGVDYVNNGAFELKAKVVTSSLGAHAGHGH